MSAMAGIDQALWDIAGKTLGVPVHQMLGGSVRDRLQGFFGGFSSRSTVGAVATKTPRQNPPPKPRQ